MAKRMAEQMELFEPVERGFEEGGLMDEGGMVDEESGNEVPPGSLREEVRDDIPAQLSEGEFVFPADVVRYIGLETLMRMRQEAKQGLAQMEAMGQMGNSEEATVQDNLPFDMYDLDVEEEKEYNMAVGGYVAPFIPSSQQQPYNQPTQVNPQTGTYTLPGTGIAGYQVPSGGQTGYTPYGGAAPYFQPVQFTGPQFQTALQTTNLPTFAETIGQRPGQYDELRTYINDAGQTMQIPFKDGKPIYPIPEGYRPIEDEPKPKEEETTVAPVVGQAQVRDDGGRDEGGRAPGATVGWGGTTEGAKPGTKIGSTPVEISFSNIGGIPGALGALSFGFNLATGKDVPDGATVGMSIDGVTTEMTANEYNTAKSQNFMGAYSDNLLGVARTNVAAVNGMVSKYGISKNPDVNRTLESFAKEAARSDVGIAELAKEYGFSIEDVKDNPFGFGKNYNDAVAKAVEKANKGYTGNDPFTADDIKDGHAARTEAKARAAALEAKAKAAQDAAKAKGDTDYGGAGTAMGDDPGKGGNIGDAAAAEASGVGTGPGGSNEYGEHGDAGYD